MPLKRNDVTSTSVKCHLGVRSGAAMVLGKLPVLGRPTNMDNSGARDADSRCGRELFGHFSSHLSLHSLFSLPLWETAQYRLKYCLKGP